MQATTPAESGKATILVAEDEESLRDIAGRVLRHAGYDVIVVSDGAQAIEALAQWGQTINLVITDVVMPEVGAEAILAYLRDQRKSTLPVICTSGYTAQQVPSEVLDDQNVQLLRKPYTLQELLGTVETILTSSE